MSLVFINDLQTQPAELIANYMAWAAEAKTLYEKFIEEDDDDVSFVAGWNSAKGRSTGIHASELSGKCQRPVWYSLTGENRTDTQIDPFWKKRFRVGHLYHGMIQDDWRRLCEKSRGLYTFQKEVKINPHLQEIAKLYDIYSSCDGVICFHRYEHGPVELRIGLEIKTESPDQFEKLKEPKLEHRRQTCVYMKCLDVPLLWTMYVNKGNQNIVPSAPPYLYTFDYKLWETIEEESRQIRHLAVENTIPDRHESIGCQFCGYSWVCKPKCLEKKEARKEMKRIIRAKQTRMRRIPGGLKVPTSGAI